MTPFRCVWKLTAMAPLTNGCIASDWLLAGINYGSRCAVGNYTALAIQP
jgi:hypothetical protein